MARLPTLPAREVIRVLERAGFKIVRQRGSHVRLRHDDGRALTVPDHHGEDLGRGLLKKILRDAELTDDEFLQWLD